MTPTTLPAGFTQALVVSGLSAPTAMEFAPDGRLFVLEQGGNVKLVHNNGTTWTALHLNVDPSGERGLLGIAFDPAFATNHYVYLYYTNKNSGGSTWYAGIHNQLSRFTVNDTNPLQPAFTSEAPILDWNSLSSATNHNGGAIHFGLDGKLYADAGDNVQTIPGTSIRVSQTLTNLLGKQLRINVAAFNSGLATRDDTKVGHLIPSNNPFVGTATGINQLIYALGLRNPFSFAVQPGTGKIFINDVGENTWEEIDQSIAGGNYGWSGGNTDGFGQTPPRPGTYHDPLLAYNHSGGPAGGGDAIVGGTFYNPATLSFPANYVGKYFYGDLSGGWIRVFDPTHPGTAANPDTSTGFATGITGTFRDLKVDAAGNLYYLTGSGTIEKVSFHGTQGTQITAQPASQKVYAGLSATFTAAASGTPTPTVQWQISTNGGISFNNIAGATSTRYTIPVTNLSQSGEEFRAVFTNTSGSATTNPATLTVVPPTGSSIDLVIETDNQVYTRPLGALGLPTGNYYQIANKPVKDLAAVRLRGGVSNFEAFVVGMDNTVYAELISGSGRTGYFKTAYGSVATVSAGTDANGNPLLFAVGTDTQLYELKFDSGGNPLGGGSFTKVADGGAFRSTVLTHDSSGNPLLYAIGQDGQVYGLKLDATGTPSATLFKVESGAVNQLVVGHDAVNAPELFVVKTNNSGAYGHKLDATGGPLGSYFSIDGAQVNAISVTDGAGNPELFVVGTDGQVYGHKFDATGNPTGVFFHAAGVAGGASSLLAGSGSDNNPQVFAVFLADSQVYAAPFSASGDPAGPFTLTAGGTVKKVVLAS